MPRIRLIKSVIDKLPPVEKGAVVYFDEDMPGFGLRKSPTKAVFIAQRDINAKTHVCTIGTYGIWTPEEARQAAREKLLMLSKGIDPDEEKKRLRAKQITLEDLMIEFLAARKKLKPRTRADYEYYLRHYLSEWMSRPVIDITDDKFKERYAYIGENNGKTVANNVRRVLGSILNFSIAAHKLFVRSPTCIIALTRSAFPDILLKPTILWPQGYDLRRYKNAMSILKPHRSDSRQTDSDG